MTQNDDMACVMTVGLPEIAVRIEGDSLISEEFDDIYFNRDDGLAESDYVFLQGSGLARRLLQAEHITIAETGFGTGLNYLAALALRDKVNPDCQIDYISFEACPLTPELIEIAHRPYPELGEASAHLRLNLPPRWPGYHKVLAQDARTVLHLYYGPALAQLRTCDFAADIWFLDGFNPAKNASLWQEALFDEVYRCSASGAQLATFTAASFVKRGLARSGFTIEKRDGFGRKREMITAYKEAGTLSAPKILPKTALIIGGGIAGASLAFALTKRGIDTTILEKGGQLASGASGNGAAMQSARLRVHNDAAGRLSVACLSYARALAEQAGVIAHHGSLTMNVRDKDQKRLDKLAKAGWPEDLFQALDRQTCQQLTGLPAIEAGDYQPASAVIFPAALTMYLAQSAKLMTHCEVLSVTSCAESHDVRLADGQVLNADLVFLACGADIPKLLAQSALPEMDFQISAGQVSWWQKQASPLADIRLGVNYGGYMTPVIDGRQYFGASFNRDGQEAVTQEGHQHNIDLLPQGWRALAPDITTAQGRLSYRLSTKDRMPVCGAIATNKGTRALHIICALGARGMTNAPLLAEMLVAKALGRPTGLDSEIIAGLDPKNAQI